MWPSDRKKTGLFESAGRCGMPGAADEPVSASNATFGGSIACRANPSSTDVTAAIAVGTIVTITAYNSR